MSVSKILAHRHLWYFKTTYQDFIEMTSNMIYSVALAAGLKCPHKLHLNSQCPPLIVHIVIECTLIPLTFISAYVIYEWSLPWRPHEVLRHPLVDPQGLGQESKSYGVE